jgi:catechol 2,3-dioxygenase-like lactoylglutathione lyase family enzyme
MVAMLRAEGVVLVDEPTMPALNGANHKFVCFLDPDGSVIELMEFFK